MPSPIRTYLRKKRDRTYVIRLYDDAEELLQPISEPIGGLYFDFDTVESHCLSLNLKLGHTAESDGVITRRPDCSLVFMFDDVEDEA